MIKKLLILFAFFLLILHVQAAKSVISGYAPGAENLTIRFYTWDDFISNREVLVDSVAIDSTGHFSFTFNLYEKQVIMGFFRIMDFTSSEMYIPANKNYSIEFQPFDYKDPNRIHIPLLSNIILEFGFKNPDPHDLNQLIGSFNLDMAGFLFEKSGINNNTSSYALKRPPKAVVDSFATAVNEKYKNENNAFFKNYYQYSLANVQLTMQSLSKKQLFNQYLNKKPILYDNVAYMEFFSNYFSDFIYGVSKKIQPYDIEVNVNMHTNLQGLVDSLGKDTLLRNEQLREAVLVLNIRDWYTQHTFRKDSLIKILNVYAATTKFDIQGKIARNLVFMLTRFNAGSALSPVTFYSLENKIFNNDSLKNKYTYLVFFATWSHACLSELLVLDKLYEEWQGRIQFVAISMDREPLKLFYFMDDHSFSFPVYHFGNNWVMAEALELQSYPHGMLIGPDGKFISYCTTLPSRGINDFFKQTMLKVKPSEEDLIPGQ